MPYQAVVEADLADWLTDEYQMQEAEIYKTAERLAPALVRISDSMYKAMRALSWERDGCIDEHGFMWVAGDDYPVRRES